jgi:uncharacterized protein (UPF0303 family)
VVKRYSRSSFFVGRAAAAGGGEAVARLQVATTSEKFSIGLLTTLSISKKYAPELDYVCHGGALPIRIKGLNFTNPIGAIVVSGLPQEQDHQLVVDACRKVLGSSATSSVL